MRFLLCLSLAVLSPLAFASFDLVLVLDQNTRSVHRYDGSTGTYLGRIQVSETNTMRGMVVDQANSRLYVADSNGVHAFDYNTGLELWYNLNSSAATDLDLRPDGTLLRGSTGATTAFRMVGLDGTANWVSATTSIGVLGAIPGVVAESNTVTGLMTSSGRYVRANSASILTDVLFPAGTYGDVNSRGSSAHVTDASNDRIYSFELLAPSGSTFTGVGTTVDAPTSVAFGHGNIRYVVGQNPTNAAQGIVARMAANSSGFLFASGVRFGTGQLTSPVAVATVIAPEPGTMTALALGGAALLRRRRKRA